MGDRRCCCRGCKLGDDNFTRPVDGPVPPDDPKWLDVQGNRWAFQNGLLVPTTTAWAPVVTRIRNHRIAPRPPAVKHYNYVIYFRAVDIGPANPSLGIIVRYAGAGVTEWIRLDAEPPLYQRLWPTFLRGNTVLMDRTTHPDSQPFAVRAGVFTGKICFADTEWSITSSPMATPELGGGDSSVEWLWTACGGGTDLLPSDSGLVGFLYGRFDSWELWDHWEVDRLACPRCSCFCLNLLDTDDYACIPENLRATIVPVHSVLQYSAPQIDFREVPLRQMFTIGPPLPPPRPLSPVKRYWHATAPITGIYPTSDTFYLACDALGRLRFTTGFYHLPWAHLPPWNENWQHVDWTESTCRPLHLVFKYLRADAMHCHTEQPPRLQLAADIASDCILETHANKLLLDSLRWRIEIVEDA